MPGLHFAVLDIEQILTPTGYRLIVTTDVPCHLWMRWTTTDPRFHKIPIKKRGVVIYCDVRFCFVNYKDNEQEEDGDTILHTFIKEPWAHCETRWFMFWGTIGGVESPSTSGLFSKHRYYIPPPEQTHDYYRPRLEVGYDKKHAIWQNAWASATGSGGSGISLYSGWYKVSTGYRIFRVGICFDTTAIPAGSSIVSAKIRAKTSWNHLMPNEDPDWFHFTESPSYPDPPNGAVYTTLRLATRKLASFYVTPAYGRAWREYDINPGALDAIKPAALTYIAFRCGRDLDNDPPPPTNLHASGCWLSTSTLPDTETRLTVTYIPP